MATTDRQKYWNPTQVMGAENDEESIPIDAITDGSGTRRLAVDATVTSGFVVETDSDLADDEILVGNTTDGGTTRNLAKGDASGRFQVDVERIGSTAPSMDGGRQQVNATLQVADADSPGGAGAVTASTPRTVTASDSPDVTALQIIDDWDESDRAKVNPIVGQAGVQGASGVVTASTQRVTLATDVGLPTGTNSIGAVTQATASNLNAQVVGTIAHDGVDSGNPVKVGGRALAHGTNPTAVAAADRTDWLFNRAGVPWVIGGHPNVQTIREERTDAEGAATNVAITTVGAGSKIVVTSLMVAVDEACTVGVGCRIGFGAAATPTTTGVVFAHAGIVPGGGATRGDGSGILGVGGDGEDLFYTADDPVGGSLEIVVTYYTIES